MKSSKIQLMSSGILAIIVSASAAHAEDASSVAQFKSEYKAKVQSLVESYLKKLDPDTSSSVAILEQAKGTQDYKTCVHPGWFTGQETQREACLRLSDELKQSLGAINERDQAREEFVAQEEQEIQSYDDALGGGRRDFATKTTSDLINAYHTQNDALTSVAIQANSDMRSQCFDRPMGEAAECAFDFTINLLENQVPALTNDARAVVESTAGQANQAIDSYSETKK